MNRQLHAVLQTYTTRRFLWLLLAWWLVGFGPTVIMGIFLDRTEGGRSVLPIFTTGFVAGIVGFVLLTQGKWQFCDPRSRLLPGFARAHVAVLLGIAALGLAVYPAFLVAVGQGSPLGIPACSIALAATLVWALHASHWAAGAAGLLMFLSLITPQGLDFWARTDGASRYALAHIVILLAGWAALIAWLWRLTALREEDDDYNIPVQSQFTLATRTERANAGRAAARKLLLNPSQRILSDWWLDRLIGVRAITLRARQRLLRYSFGATPIYLQALLMSVSLFGMFYLLSRFSLSSKDAGGVNLSSLSVMIVCPAMMPGGVLAMHRPRMAQELLLPFSRRDYLAGLSAAVGRIATIMWIALHAALLGLIVLRAPDMVTFGLLAAVTCLSLSVHVYAFGILTWISRMSSGSVRLVAIMVIVAPAMIALTAGLKSIELKQPPAPLHPTIPASLEQNLTTEQRAMVEQYIQRHEEQVRKSMETNPAIAWSIAASLATVGVVTYVTGRRKWLDAELA